MSRLRSPLHIVLIALGSMLLPAAGRSQEPADISTYATITDPHTASTVVARVGPLAITAREFLLSYEFGPAFPKRGPDSRERYVNFMTNEKLLALDGYARGIEQLPRARAMLGEIEADLATVELYKADILPRIRVANVEEEKGIQQQLVSVSLSWLYATDQRSIDTFDRALRAGASFDSLARLEGDSLAQVRSLEETRFSLGHTSPAVAAIVDTLQEGKPLRPIHGPDGWYIFMLRHVWTSPVPTESEVVKMRNDVRRQLMRERADSLSDAYIHRLMDGRRPVIIRSSLNALEAAIGRVVLTAQQYDTWGLQHAYKAPEMSSGDTLVTLDGPGCFLVSDFMQWYRARETALHFQRASRGAFSRSLEQFVWRMIRDRLLAQRARARGMQNKESVRTQRKWWEQKIVYDLVRSELEQAVSVQDSSVRVYYEVHRARYASKTGKNVAFDDVKSEVRRDIFDEEFSKVLFRRLLALRKQYPVTVNNGVLSRLPVDTVDNPRAIDVYMAKTGGIFPRQAFPTIDYRWQSWE